MGQRANLVLVKNGGYDLYYSHWAANSIDTALFWGPAHAIAYIQSQKKVDQDQWLDTVWAEGGVVLDPHNKVILWYGGESTNWELVYRQLFLRLMREVWKDWSVRWAYNEIVDMADYVGYPRDLVIAEGAPDENRVTLDPAEDGKASAMTAVMSILDESGNVSIIPLSRHAQRYLLSGPACLKQLSLIPVLKNLVIDWRQLDADDSTESNPYTICYSGVHIDTAGKTVSYWGELLYPDELANIAALWPGWQVAQHYDEFYWQEAVSHGALQFLTRTQESLLQEITFSLLKTGGISNVASFLNTVTTLRRDANEVTVNPNTLLDTPFELSESQRLLVWEDAVTALFGYEEMEQQKRNFFR